MHLNLVEVIKTVGYLGVWGIVFAESGLFFGFFLPGDSLLFTAGFLASQNILSFPILTAGIVLAAIIGDSVGYTFGQKVGQKLYSRSDSKFFKKEHLEKAHRFYEKYGGKTIIIARFVPFIRTFAPIVAGAANMSYQKFISYNIFGGLLWGVGVTGVGFFLGNLIPNVDRYLLPIIALIVFVSILPPIFEYVKSRRHANR